MAGRKFRFSLDPVLKLRQHEAEQAEQALAHALRLRQDREAHLEAADALLRALPTEGAARKSETPADFRRFAATQNEAMRARKQASKALEAARHRERDARRALLAARRPEDALHTLRDQQEQTHRYEQQRVESNQLDDQATAAYCRQMRTDA